MNRFRNKSIKDGSVLIIFREYPSSEEKEVDTRHKGSIIGEAALYNDNSIRTASVEVISSSSELVKMTRDELLQAASKNNELKDAIASLASLRHARSIQTSLLCGHDVTVKNEICSILVADIHHFSHLGENVWSELSNSFLYRFIWECERITSKYSCVFEDQGDGFKIIFRGIDHSHRAIKCAKEICKSFSELRTEYINEENSFRLIGLGIGIVSDFLSIIFRTGEKEYIVGNSINIASAISKYRADPDEIGVYLHPGVFLYSNKNELTIEGPSKKWLDKIAKSVDLFRLKLV